MNSVEPAVQNLTSIDLFFANEEWAKLRRAGAEKCAQLRLDGIAASLAGRDYLEGEFTAGDLLMVTVLRILRHTDLVKNMPVLAAYQARCEARPAFQRALDRAVRAFREIRPGRLNPIRKVCRLRSARRTVRRPVDSRTPGVAHPSARF